MPLDSRHAMDALRELLRTHTGEELLRKLAPKTHPAPPKVLSGSDVSQAIVDARWRALPSPDGARAVLLDAATAEQASLYARNIENFVGTVKLPVGIAGPIRVNGTHAQGDYYVPLATTEAALVASYSRGAQIITEAGGCSAILTNEGVSRAPGFAFRTLHEAGQFVAWAMGALPELKRVADGTSRHGRLKDMRVSIEGNHVYLIFDYSTGDAAGQNMVTIATQAVCDYIARECPLAARYAFVEANHSGDKKASAQSFITGRGKSVTADVVIPRTLVEGRLHTTPEMMARYWAMSAVGGVLSGTIGVQGHYANGLAAIYLACGQDVACVAESAVGVTRIESQGDAMYMSVTLPNLVVGTVGGATALPSQRACLQILGLAGPGHAQAFAEVCAAVSLAGELSIVAALCAGEFAEAHQRLARAPAAPPPGRPA
ncbi:MAG TPA: hydroxymethylglutaryl-CoA reductase [Gemmatimonadaceae bacterium]|nr:hydroxymethylglutaryl-CoA reductase [Gemmatimonadaceae bacterium]